MRKAVSGFLGIGLMAVCAFNVEAEGVSFSSVAFKSVDYSIGAGNGLISFKNAVIKGELMDVSVAADSVEVLLAEELGEYTTIELINVLKEEWSWLTVEKVIVAVRRKDDLIIWQKFLSEIKRLQTQRRKRMLEPIRVLPPIQLN